MRDDELIEQVNAHMLLLADVLQAATARIHELEKALEWYVGDERGRLRTVFAGDPPLDHPHWERAAVLANVPAESATGRWVETPGGVAGALNRYDQVYARPCGRYVHDNTDDGVRYCRCGFAEAVH